MPSTNQISRLGLLLIAALFAACAAPIAVHRVDPEVAHRALTANALSADEPSNPTLIVLRRYDLTASWEETPDEAISALHERVAEGKAGSDELYALAELSFLRGQDLAESGGTVKKPRVKKGDPPPPRPDRATVQHGNDLARENFLASSIYAYAFLFPENRGDEISLIDPRVRVAADIYNTALAEALSGGDGNVHPQAGAYPLPFGTIVVTFDQEDLHWGKRKLVDFLPTSDVEVIGLNNRYRRGGIGAPLAAHAVPRDPNSPPHDFVPAQARVPVTALLRIARPREQLRDGTKMHGDLEIYAATDTDEVKIGDREMPLEVDPTAALAASLQQSAFWDGELARFLGRALRVDRDTRLFAWEPHHPGRIPVVFVHGTGSNPSVWADMVNDLQADPRIRQRYEFWFFTYESGNPIAYSSLILRRSLTDAIQNLQPEEKGTCLENMVVIGHSQGGLLTKETVIDSGNTFWEAISPEKFDDVELKPKARALLQEGLFVKPLPFVKRVVFISTPHRGSYLAGWQFVQRLAARMIEFPGELTDLARETVGGEGSVRAKLKMERLATSIDNMSPNNRFIKALASIPVTPGIPAHSIISVEGDGEPDLGDDGVVEYSSAHIDGVESELVVASGHSCQSNPHTIEEVRRILLEHLTTASCPGPPGSEPNEPLPPVEPVAEQTIVESR